jgi:hypothetical protein
VQNSTVEAVPEGVDGPGQPAENPEDDVDDQVHHLEINDVKGGFP